MSRLPFSRGYALALGSRIVWGVPVTLSISLYRLYTIATEQRDAMRKKSEVRNEAIQQNRSWR
jgi:hypothetical protein